MREATKVRPMTRQWGRDRHGQVEYLPRTVPYPARITLPFPLKGFMASITIPLDLKQYEAERFCRYIMTLVIPDA